MSTIFLSTPSPAMIAPALARAVVVLSSAGVQPSGWASEYTPIPSELQDLAREEHFSGSLAKSCDQGTPLYSLVIRAIRMSASTMLEDLTDTSLDVDQGERIELLELLGQSLFRFLRNMPREQDPLAGCQRLVLFALDLFSDTLLFDLLHRWDEIVQQEPKRSAKQGIEHGHDRKGCQTSRSRGTDASRTRYSVRHVRCRWHGPVVHG